MATRAGQFGSPAVATTAIARVAARMSASPERAASVATPEPRIDFMAANPRMKESPETTTPRSRSPVRERASLLNPGAGPSRLGDLAYTKARSVVSSKSVPAMATNLLGHCPPKQRSVLTTASPSKHRQGDSLYDLNTASRSVAVDAESEVGSTTRRIRRLSSERLPALGTPRGILASAYPPSHAGGSTSGTPLSERDRLRMELRLTRKKDPS